MNVSFWEMGEQRYFRVSLLSCMYKIVENKVHLREVNDSMKWKKKSLMLILIFLVVMQGTGCAKEQKAGIPEGTSVPAVTVASEENSIQVYTIDEDSMESVSETVYLMDDEKITAKNIIKEVIDLFDMHSITIHLDTITEKEDTIYISFQKDGAPVHDVSETVEEIILESIAKSLVDNLEGYEKVVFQVEGEAYKSDNIQLEKDEVYWWK